MNKIKFNVFLQPLMKDNDEFLKLWIETHKSIDLLVLDESHKAGNIDEKTYKNLVDYVNKFYDNAVKEIMEV